ncbi:hypothetical protein Tco_1217434 [Tanacetum coccineum]
MITMANNRLVAQLLEAPTEGYEDAEIELNSNTSNKCPELKRARFRTQLPCQESKAVVAKMIKPSTPAISSDFLNQRHVRALNLIEKERNPASAPKYKRPAAANFNQLILVIDLPDVLKSNSTSCFPPVQILMQIVQNKFKMRNHVNQNKTEETIQPRQNLSTSVSSKPVVHQPVAIKDLLLNTRVSRQILKDSHSQ